MGAVNAGWGDINGLVKIGARSTGARKGVMQRHIPGGTEMYLSRFPWRDCLADECGRICLDLRALSASVGDCGRAIPGRLQDMLAN